MITKDTKESRIKTRSKILVLGFIFVILVGLFGPMAKTHAAPTVTPFCVLPDGSIKTDMVLSECSSKNGTPKTELTTQESDTLKKQSATDIDFDCSSGLGTGFFSMGCLAQGAYNIWFVTTFIVRFSGHILDYFVYYSTNSTSYDNVFINKGWGAVRDVANIFFIVTLLYIAIKTVLSLDSSGSKKMISYVVIIALVINFSLFTTKVVIDASNILAKIFYNNITSIGPNGAELKPEDGGQKSISVGIFDKFNPQEIVGGPTGYKDAGVGMFIFIVLLALVITLYTSYVFLAIAVLFVARVVSLWIAMIFSPLAFISYAVPFDVPFGHKEWWDDLLKNAFLAPILIFFLYIIVLFTDFLKNLPAFAVGDDTLQKLIAIIIPFAILMMLIMKAKSLAVKYSGKIGEAVMSGAKMVGGLALGVGAGALAMGGKTILGGGGGYVAGKLASGANKMGDTKWGNRLGMNKVASGLTGLGSFAQKSSFDVRGVKVAGKSLSSLTGMNVGEAGKGGIAQARKDKVEKRRKRAELLNVREDEGLKQSLNKTEEDLQALLSANVEVMDSLDKTIEKKRQEVADTNNKLNAARGTPDEAVARTALDNANTDLRLAKENKKDFRAGRDYITTNSAGIDTYNTGTAVNIDAMEEQKKDQTRAIKTESRRRKVAFANRKGNWGMLSSTANKEARHKIIMESKIESSGESH